VRALFYSLLGILATALLAAASGWLVLEAGLYNVGATQQHFQLVHSLLERGMHQSVRFHARGIVPPPLGAPGQLASGATAYKQHCQQCHGGPGAAQEGIGLSMLPVPGPLVDASRRFSSRELYWVVRHGIKMSGMPAWEFRLKEDELWAVVAFLERLPHMTPAEYRLAGRGAGDVALDLAVGGAVRGAAEGALKARERAGDAGRGRLALTQWACQACHRIPGVTGPDTHVGPPLRDLRQRRFIAGSLPMGEDTLVRWIMQTHAIDPATAMPQLGVPERDARDMAAYLLRQ